MLLQLSWSSPESKARNVATSSSVTLITTSSSGSAGQSLGIAPGFLQELIQLRRRERGVTDETG